MKYEVTVELKEGNEFKSYDDMGESFGNWQKAISYCERILKEYDNNIIDFLYIKQLNKYGECVEKQNYIMNGEYLYV
mgnify:CR=1 FL=1